MKWSNLLVALTFVAFAVVQLNDPDPFGWVTLYGAVALMWGGAAFGRYYLPIIHLLMAISLLWMISLLPDFITWLQNGAESIVQSMKAEKPQVELTREFLGLAIILVALGGLWKNARRER